MKVSKVTHETYLFWQISVLKPLLTSLVELYWNPLKAEERHVETISLSCSKVQSFMLTEVALLFIALNALGIKSRQRWIWSHSARGRPAIKINSSCSSVTGYILPHDQRIYIYFFMAKVITWGWKTLPPFKLYTNEILCWRSCAFFRYVC